MIKNNVDMKNKIIKLRGYQYGYLSEFLAESRPIPEYGYDDSGNPKRYEVFMSRTIIEPPGVCFSVAHEDTEEFGRRHGKTANYVPTTERSIEESWVGNENIKLF